MVEYLSDIKIKINLIAASSSPISVEDTIFYTLNGLPSSYQSFKTIIRTSLQLITLDDFYSLLCSEETSQATEQNCTEGLSHSALVSHRSQERGRWQSNPTS